METSSSNILHFPESEQKAVDEEPNSQLAPVFINDSVKVLLKSVSEQTDLTEVQVQIMENLNFFFQGYLDDEKISYLFAQKDPSINIKNLDFFPFSFYDPHSEPAEPSVFSKDDYLLLEADSTISGVKTQICFYPEKTLIAFELQELPSIEIQNIQEACNFIGESIELIDEKIEIAKQDFLERKAAQFGLDSIEALETWEPEIDGLIFKKIDSNSDNADWLWRGGIRSTVCRVAKWGNLEFELEMHISSNELKITCISQQGNSYSQESPFRKSDDLKKIEWFIQSKKR